MAEFKHKCDCYLIRYLPDPFKGERVNMGFVLRDLATGKTEVRFSEHLRRVQCLEPSTDLAALLATAESLKVAFENPAMFDWNVAKFSSYWSNNLELCESQAVLTNSIETAIETLVHQYLEVAPALGKNMAGRPLIHSQMRDAFEKSNVWALMQKRIPVSPYTFKGDPLKVDCGYAVDGSLKMFHAVSLRTDLDSAKVLAFSYPDIQQGVLRIRNERCEMTAIVEDELDRTHDSIAYAIDALQKRDINIGVVSELPLIADRARQELKA
jgi:hypothetical protein